MVGTALLCVDHLIKDVLRASRSLAHRLLRIAQQQALRMHQELHRSLHQHRATALIKAVDLTKATEVGVLLMEAAAAHFPHTPVEVLLVDEADARCLHSTRHSS